MLTARQVLCLTLTLAAATAVGCAARSPTRFAVTEGPTLPIEVAGHAGGIVSGFPVIAGGSSWVGEPKTKIWRQECYILRDGTWKPGPRLPTGLADAAYAHDETGLYIAGGVNGKDPSDRVLRLANADGQWQTLPSLPQPTEAAAGAILNGKFYVVAGAIAGKSANQLLSLDLRAANASWKTLAPLPAAGRSYGALVALDSQLYFFGGFATPPDQPQVTIFSEVFEYSPTNNEWRRVTQLSIPGYGWTATHIGDGVVMLTGRVPRLSFVSDEILLVDLKKCESSEAGKLVQPNCCMPVIPTGPARWLIPGGEPDTNRSRSARTSIVERSK